MSTRLIIILIICYKLLGKSINIRYCSAYTRLAQYFSPFEYRQYGGQQGQLPTLTCFNETQDAAVHLRTIQRAKASGHFLAILTFAQITFTQIVVKRYCCIVQEQQIVRLVCPSRVVE